MGLDWDAIRANYEKRATPEELAPVVAQPKPVRPRKSRAKSSAPNYRGPKPTFDVEEAMRLYLTGLTISQIAEKLDLKHDTVYGQLKKDPRYDPARDRGGSKPKDLCKSGHDYNEVGFYQTKKGGRDCKACKRERDKKKRRKGSIKDKSTCKNGHKYDEVGYYRATKGGRECKACKKEYDAARYREKMSHG